MNCMTVNLKPRQEVHFEICQNLTQRKISTLTLDSYEFEFLSSIQDLTPILDLALQDQPIFHQCNKLRKNT